SVSWARTAEGYFAPVLLFSPHNSFFDFTKKLFTEDSDEKKFEYPKIALLSAEICRHTIRVVI
ncbi:hypothetical protein GE061_007285, partial [Apolygus lucorum]